MRYLKTFEDIDTQTLKKYVVWKFPTNLIISELIKYDKDFSVFNKLYRYAEGSDDIYRVEEGISTYNKHEIKKRVVYDSNNLQELLNIELLSAFFDTEKYNL